MKILVLIAAIGLCVALAGWAIWLIVRHNRTRKDWNPLGRNVLGRASLIGTMPCVECSGDLGQCRSWCRNVGGRGDDLANDRDPRRVDEEVARRTRRRVVAT